MSASTMPQSTAQTGKTALLIVDVQNDFLPPTGSLQVPGGLLVVPPIAKLLTDTKDFPFELVIASQDWHPEGHISFASSHPGHKAYQDLEVKDARGFDYEQKLWPDHCIQDSKGAQLAADLVPKLEAWGDKYKLARKGWHKGIEAYSAFDGYLTDGTNPGPVPTEIQKQPSKAIIDYLRNAGVTKVVITGLATDYCVAHTALSAFSARFEVAILVPAVRAISELDADAVFDKFSALGGTMIGRRGDGRWEQDLKAWIAK